MERKKGVIIEHKKDSYYVKEKTTYLTIREFYVLQGYPLQRAYRNKVMKSSIPSVICSSPILFPFCMIFAEAWFVGFNLFIQNACDKHISDARAT